MNDFWERWGRRSTSAYYVHWIYGPPMGRREINGSSLVARLSNKSTNHMLHMESVGQTNHGDMDANLTQRITPGWAKWRQVSGILAINEYLWMWRGNVIRYWFDQHYFMGRSVGQSRGARDRASRWRRWVGPMFQYMNGVSRRNRIRNEYIMSSLRVADIGP